MSSSDYTNIRRLRRTVGNLPFNTCENYMENMKMKNIDCIYKTEQSFSIFDVLSKTSFTNCLSNVRYSKNSEVRPIVTKNSIIQTPLYVKNRTINRKCCFPNPSIRAGCSNPVILRVCNKSYSVMKNINT